MLGTSATYALNSSVSLVFSMVSEKIIVCFCLLEIIYVILSTYITPRLPRIHTKQMHFVSYLAYPMHLAMSFAVDKLCCHKLRALKITHCKAINSFSCITLYVYS